MSDNAPYQQLSSCSIRRVWLSALVPLALVFEQHTARRSHASRRGRRYVWPTLRQTSGLNSGRTTLLVADANGFVDRIKEYLPISDFAARGRLEYGLNSRIDQIVV